MDSRLKDLAEKLDAGLIARREFLRNAAVITGGTAAGLHALSGHGGRAEPTKLRVWLFKSFVTAGNDVLAKQIAELGQGPEGRRSRSTGPPSATASRSSSRPSRPAIRRTSPR